MEVPTTSSSSSLHLSSDPSLDLDSLLITVDPLDATKVRDQPTILISIPSLLSPFFSNAHLHPLIGVHRGLDAVCYHHDMRGSEGEAHSGCDQPGGRWFHNHNII